MSTYTALDVPCDFSISMDISHVYDVKNPDGSNPVASVKLKGDSIRTVLSVFSEAHEQMGEMLAELVIDNNADEIGINMDEIDERINNGGDLTDEEMAKINAFMEQKVVPFRELEFNIRAVMNGEDEENVSTFIATAPSYLILIEVMEALSNPNKVNQVVAGFMNNLDEEDEDNLYYGFDDEDDDF